MSKSTRDKRGNHVWDGSKETETVKFGGKTVKVTRWDTGTIGGVSESNYAEAVFPKKLTKAEVAKFEETARVGAGSPFGKMEPQVEKTDEGHKYTWLYSPSTE